MKGESLVDTAETLSAMACDLVIVRHKYAGSPRMLAEHMDAHVINGGDGDAPAPHAGAARPVHDARAARARSRASRSASSATSATRASPARSIPALRMVGATPIVIAPPTLLPARPDVLGAEVVRRRSTRCCPSSTSPTCCASRWSAPRACRSRACASTRGSTA